MWRRPGERYNSSHTVLLHTARTAGVMVWGAIAYDSRSTLIVMRGTLTGQRYVDDILRPHTLPWTARSSDLSPVEHVWDQRKRQMPSFPSVHDLELAVQDVWAHLPQDNISYSRAFGDLPRHFEPWSSDEDKTCYGNSSLNFPTTTIRGRFSIDRFNDVGVEVESRIIGKLEEGRSVTSVAAEFGIAHSIVSRLWRQFQTTGTAIRGFSSGRPRGITPADDRYIVLQARRNRRQTVGEIARHTTQATGRPISRFTVARRLRGGGLFARRPVRCVPLTPAHRRKRSL
ncbi:transposable element Tcb2 transposase [Trichonephila clavipes]|nr:transposable element Tcb2 transposase [Trichonephila clavipes]